MFEKSFEEFYTCIRSLPFVKLCMVGWQVVVGSVSGAVMRMFVVPLCLKELTNIIECQINVEVDYSQDLSSLKKAGLQLSSLLKPVMTLSVRFCNTRILCRPFTDKLHHTAILKDTIKNSMVGC